MEVRIQEAQTGIRLKKQKIGYIEDPTSERWRQHTTFIKSMGSSNCHLVLISRENLETLVLSLC